MCPESRIVNPVVKISWSLRISIIRDLSLTILFAVCCTTQLFPAIHPVPLYKNIDGAYCLKCPAVNPELQSEGNPFIGFRNLKA
jgi:hypothetical protein